MSHQQAVPPTPQADTRGVSAQLGDPLVAAALVVLVVFGLFTLLLLWQVKGAPEATWLRYMYIFASVEAIAFAAAGALFGTQVSRAAVERERARADRAEAQAHANARALAENQAIRKLANQEEVGETSHPRSASLTDEAFAQAVRTLVR